MPVQGLVLAFFLVNCIFRSLPGVMMTQTPGYESGHVWTRRLLWLRVLGTDRQSSVA